MMGKLKAAAFKVIDYRGVIVWQGEAENGEDAIRKAISAGVRETEIAVVMK